MSTQRYLALTFGTIFALLASGTSLAATPAKAPVNSGSLNGDVLVRNDGIFLRCNQCGTVEAIERNVTAGRNHGTAGAIIGAVAGGVLGNQVGKGDGRKLATVAGAVGGGFAGNAIGKGGGGETFTLRLRMGDGSYSNITVADASTIRAGDLVQVDPNGNVVRIQ